MSTMSALEFVTAETHRLSQFHAHKTHNEPGPVPERTLEQWRYEFKLWEDAQ